MKKYKYMALNLQKQKFNGTFYAENEDSLRKQLMEQNLFLVTAKVVKDVSPNPFFSFTGKLSNSELTAFCRQFSIMINSGISILECIFILKEQSFTGYFKKILEMVYEDVKTGHLLSEAFKKHKKFFPEFFVNMVYVGEVSGKLDTVFKSLSDYYEKDAIIKRKVKGALRYPLILFCMLIGVVSLMMFFIIPTFKESMSSLDVELPKITLIIYGMSDWLKANIINIVLVILISILLIIIISRTKAGRMFFDELKLKIPIYKDMELNLLTSRFVNGFGLLISSGLDMVESLEVINRVMGNKYFQKKFMLAIEDIRQGMSLTMAFEAYKLFPNVLIQMISVGEKSDSIAEVLDRSKTFFDEKVEGAINTFSSILQPVMLIIMGVAIAIMFIAIYSPMIGIMNGLGNTEG